jgi:hypothetical protein
MGRRGAGAGEQSGLKRDVSGARRSFSRCWVFDARNSRQLRTSEPDDVGLSRVAADHRCVLQVQPRA